MNPVVQMMLPSAGESVATKIGGQTGKKAFKTAMKITNLPSTIASGTMAATSTINSFKNAAKNNQYHNKLNKVAEEKDDDKKQDFKKKITKATPYVVAGSTLLAYGGKALKDKSLSKPVKEAMKSVPDDIVNQIKQKSKTVKNIAKGAKDGIKKNNIVIINKNNASQPLLNRMAQGAAWGTGVLGVHLIGDKYFKSKDTVRKSYNKSQPSTVKAVESIGKKIPKIVHNGDEDNEKTAEIKWGKVIQKGVIEPSLTALPVYVASQISGTIRDSARKTARNAATNNYYKNKQRRKEENSDEEKTASVRKDLKFYGSKFKENFGTDIMTQMAKPITSTVATVPIILGHEYIKSKMHHKKKEKQQKEWEAKNVERKDNRERRHNNYGRDYKGRKEYTNIKSDVQIAKKRSISENSGAVRD